MGSIADSGGHFSSRVLLLLRIENRTPRQGHRTGRQGAPVRRIRPMFHPLTWISPVFAGSFTIPLGTARIERDRSGIQAKRASAGRARFSSASRRPGPPGGPGDGAPLPDGASSHASSMSRVYVLAERYVSNKDNNAASIRGLPLARYRLYPGHLASPT